MDLKREKLINAVIYFTQHTKICGKTKLVKLLYYLDFMHFRQTAKAVTGLRYYAWQFGPYPVEFGKEIDNPPTDLSKAVLIRQDEEKKFFTIKTRKKFNPDVFSRRELQLLGKISFIFKEANSEDMVDASHLPNHPWDKTIKTKGEKEQIDYLLALDDHEDSISIEDAEDIIRDRKVLCELASTTQR